MKNTKILILTLCLSLLTLSNAYGFENTKYDAYAEKLSQIGVFKGTGSGFELDRQPTRLEGLVMLIRLLGKEDEVLASPDEASIFSDVPNWGISYVNYAFKQGLTTGITPSEFGSYQTIDGKSYMTFLLRALGYDDKAGDFTWNEALEKGQTLGLIDSPVYSTLKTDDFYRDHIAYLSYNTLKSNTKTGNVLINNLIDSGDMNQDIAISIGLAKLSRKQDLVNRFNALKTTLDQHDAIYIEEPTFTAPFTPGKLTAEFINDGVNYTNFIRYLAYLDNSVGANQEWNQLAQHAAVIIKANKLLSHYPAKPETMDDAFYTTAAKGAETSNLAMGFPDLEDTIMGYMGDSDVVNIDRLGHRRWLLNPPMDTVGFGFASEKGSRFTEYSAMKVFTNDSNNIWKYNEDYDYVAWPSEEAFPIEFFNNHDAWSVSLNFRKYNPKSIGSIKVTLTQMGTDKKWIFNQEDLVKADKEGKYFNINTDGFGIPYCIIFRPDNATYYDGATFEVKIENIYDMEGNRKTITFRTEFFNLE